MREDVFYFYKNGKQLTNRMKRFLFSKGFTEETLNLLNFYNLSKLAAEYHFEE